MIIQTIHRIILDPTKEHRQITQMESANEWCKIRESTAAIVFEQKREFVINDMEFNEEGNDDREN